MIKRINTAQPKPSTDYEKLGNGQFEGRLVYIADLGLQEGMTWQGEKKPDRQQLALGIEIVGNHVTIDDVERPRILWTKPFNTFSTLTAKGKETEIYKAFDPTASEKDDCDWESLLGTPCTVIVEAVTSKDGSKTFDNIKALTSIPEKYQKDVPAAELEFGVGDHTDEDNAVNKCLFGLAKYVFDKRIDETDVPF